MKVALVHDWLTGMRGGERMLERVARMWPGAPIYTLVWKRGSVSATVAEPAEPPGPAGPGTGWRDDPPTGPIGRRASAP